MCIELQRFLLVSFQEFPWHPKPLDVLTEDSVSVVNEQACLMYISGSEAKEAEEKAKELLTDIATAYCEKQKASRSSSSALPELSVLYQGEEVNKIR